MGTKCTGATRPLPGRVPARAGSDQNVPVTVDQGDVRGHHTTEQARDRDVIDSGWIAALHGRATTWLERQAWYQAAPWQAPRDGQQLRLFGDDETEPRPTPVTTPPWSERSFWLLTAVMVVWAAVFGRLTVLRYERFASFGFDMGIFDQAIWLLSHFEGQFITVRGLDVFGHHGSFAFYLLAPFYWLGAGPNFLNVAQVVTAAAGAVPVYLLARDRLGGPWMAAFLAGAFLLHPALQFLMWEQFHPEAMAITPLLFAYWFSVRERWGWFGATAALAVLWKEDVALGVVVLGLLVAARGHRRLGLTTAGLALGWFLFVAMVLIPAFSVDTFYVSSFFSTLGDSPGEIVWNSVSHPSRVIEPVTAPDARDYLFRMTAPYGFVPLAAPATLAIGIPQTLANLLSVNDFTRRITFHYAALPLAALTLATVEGIRLGTKRRAVRRVLVGIVFGSSLAATVSWGPSPIGDEYRAGWWPLTADSRQDTKEAALAHVPSDAAVSATYQFVPHLSQRRTIYEWPNPFRPANWGVANENYPDPSTAGWVAVDRRLVGDADRALLEGLLAGGEFRVVFDQDDVVVAHRPSAAPG